MRVQIDRGLFVVIIFLLGLGLVQVYSSSFIFAIESFDDGLFFVKKQAVFAVASIALLLALSYSPAKYLEKICLAVWAAACVGVVLTLIPGIGLRVGGAARWLQISSAFRIQPSEFLKYTMPVALAYMLTNEKYFEPRLRNLLRWTLFLMPVGLLLKQPDFGSFAIITVVGFSILFVNGLKWRYVIAGLSTLSVAFYFLIARVGYRMTRITAFLDPWSDPEKKGFQVIQSMLGFHSGGVTGVGLGQGQGKLFFLPEAHTDFTMSVLGEELGFVGVVAVLMIFGFVVLRGLQITANADSERQKIISLGVTLTFAITTLVNAGVAMGLLPTKGLGMPFLSYGGSHLLAACVGLGLLLNIDRQARKNTARAFIKIKSH